MELGKLLKYSIVFAIVGILIAGKGAYYQMKFKAPATDMKDVKAENLEKGMVVDGSTVWSVGPYRSEKKLLGRHSYNRLYLIALADGNFISLMASDSEDPSLYRLSQISMDDFKGQPQDVTADPAYIHGIVKNLPEKYRVDMAMYVNKLNESSPNKKIDVQKCTSYYIDYETTQSAAIDLKVGLVVLGISVLAFAAHFLFNK